MTTENNPKPLLAAMTELELAMSPEHSKLFLEVVLSIIGVAGVLCNDSIEPNAAGSSFLGSLAVATFATMENPAITVIPCRESNVREFLNEAIRMWEEREKAE